MNIAEQAYVELFSRQPEKDLVVKYSGRFSGYNANVRYTSATMVFALSRQWKGVSADIQIGLVQSLLLKVYKEKKDTLNIDMYNIFLRKVGQSTVPVDSEPGLLESFERVNRKYFGGSIQQPNLIWGGQNTRKMGSYDYGKDTIMISSILRDRQDLLDYVMHHEMLHKKFKFSTKNGRSYHHTREFREAEKRFESHAEMEKKLSSVVGKRRAAKKISGFFSWLD